MARAIVQSTFTTATKLKLSQPLELPKSSYDYLGGIITELEYGCISMLESNDLHATHQELHHIMVKAVQDGWKVTLVDLANCFNPQQISALAFEYGVNGNTVLEKIGLARPFQIHQATSIIKDLVKHISAFDSNKQLIIVTDISSLFFDPSLKNEDPQFPIPQLEMMRQAIGILQSLAVQGSTILITDKTERTKSIMNLEEPPQIKATSLQYSAKVHITIHHVKEVGQRRVELRAHPFFEHKTEIVNDIMTKLANMPKKQLSLSAFF